MKKTIKKSSYRHGQWFRATIQGGECVGRISINSDKNDGVFLCQDIEDGYSADYKLGFLFSWTIGKGSSQDLKNHEVTNLKLLSRKPASFKKSTSLPHIGDYKAILINGGETIKVGCTPVSRELYLEVGRKVGWIE
jgi:hypothetical protein